MPSLKVVPELNLEMEGFTIETTDYFENWNRVHRQLLGNDAALSNMIKDQTLSKDGTAKAAEKLSQGRRIDGAWFNGNSDIHHYAVCNSAADAQVKQVSIDGVNLSYGSRIIVKFYNGNTAENPQLNLNGIKPWPIVYKGEPIPAGYIKPKTVLELVYDQGEKWHVVGDVTQYQVDQKADKDNPVFTGTFSHNRKAGSQEGERSFAEGSDCTASGKASHAEGGSTRAQGKYTHAEGYSAFATGDYSHVEGFGTKASRKSQHVEGAFNVEDTEGSAATDRGKYVHIIGNGMSDTQRSNAHTVDWEGNAEYAGDVIANGCGGKNPVSMSVIFDQLRANAARLDSLTCVLYYCESSANNQYKKIDIGECSQFPDFLSVCFKDGNTAKPIILDVDRTVNGIPLGVMIPIINEDGTKYGDSLSQGSVLTLKYSASGWVVMSQGYNVNAIGQQVNAIEEKVNELHNVVWEELGKYTLPHYDEDTNRLWSYKSVENIVGESCQGHDCSILEVYQGTYKIVCETPENVQSDMQFALIIVLDDSNEPYAANSAPMQGGTHILTCDKTTRFLVNSTLESGLKIYKRNF